jgi:hypothetical protein
MHAGGDIGSEPENGGWSIPMMDVVMVALAFGFFAVSIAYVYACERL